MSRFVPVVRGPGAGVLFSDSIQDEPCAACGVRTCVFKPGRDDASIAGGFVAVCQGCYGMLGDEAVVVLWRLKHMHL